MKEVLMLIVLFIVLGGIYYYNSAEGGTCEAIKKDILEKLDEINTCEVDSDCVLGYKLGCPFGCEQLYNKDTGEMEFAYLDEKYAQYQNSCDICEYDCIMVDESDVKCIGGKCQVEEII